MDTSIFNGGGSSICSNDDHETWLDHGCNRDSSYCQNQVSAGTYTLEVGSFNDEPGTAILTVECVDANVHTESDTHLAAVQTNPTSVECGQTYTFSTSTAEPRWEPTLALGTAKAVALHTCKTPGTAMDTHIFNDGGNSICSNDDQSVLTGSSIMFEKTGDSLGSLSSAIGGCNDHDSYCSNQVTAGTYTLSIGSYDDLQTGTAMLTVECADVQTNPEVVECGQSYTYTISTGEPKWEPKLTIATAQKVTLHTCDAPGTTMDTQIFEREFGATDREIDTTRILLSAQTTITTGTNWLTTNPISPAAIQTTRTAPTKLRLAPTNSPSVVLMNKRAPPRCLLDAP